MSEKNNPDLNKISSNQFRTVEQVKIRVLESESDEKNKVIEFSFSSEVPYKRWWGTEIISHEKGAINLERFEAGAPLLFNHDRNLHLGIITKAWISESEKRGFVKCKLARNEFAKDKSVDIEDGILVNASFGYMINELKLTKESDDGDEYTVTKCTPFEASLVTVPADFTVGMGRDADIANPAIDLLAIRSLSKPKEPINPQPIQTPVQVVAPQGVRMSEEQLQQAQRQAGQAEKNRQAQIRELGKKFNKTALAEELINGDKSIEEAREAFLTELGHKQVAITGAGQDIGMSNKDIKTYSIMRAIRAMLEPNNKTYQNEAAFEREISEEAAKKAGTAPKGFMIPMDVLRSALFMTPEAVASLMSRRDLVAGTPTAGGNLVATELLTGSFIEMLRKKSALQRAGAQYLTGLVGNIAIPRQYGAATHYWVGEGGAPTESAPAFDQVTMGPKTIGAFIDYSRKLMLQSSPDVESLVRFDLAKVIALGIDHAGLYGLGSSNQPLGLKGTTGINTEDFGAANPTFAEIVSMESKVAADDADVENMKYIFNAAMRGTLKTAPKVSGHPIFIMEGNQVNGYDTVVSNQAADGDVFFGDWSNLLIGAWSGLDLLIDPYTGSKEGNVRVVGHQDVDVAARQAVSFTYGNNNP